MPRIIRRTLARMIDKEDRLSELICPTESGTSVPSTAPRTTMMA
jgi:hypothetical protein